MQNLIYILFKKLVRKCCVANYNGNCNVENKVKTFMLPQNRRRGG